MHTPSVTIIGTTWVPEIDLGELARIIAGKDRKLDAYRKKCAIVWLLIVVDGFRMSSVTEAPIALAAMPSAFDRVLVLHDRTAVAVLAG